MKSFIASAFVAGAFAVATPATAATTITLTPSADGSFSGTSGAVTPDFGSFSDAYEFSVPNVGVISANALSLSIVTQLTLTGGFLNDIALQVQEFSTSPNAFKTYYLSLPTGYATIPTGANPQKLVINGNSQGGGSYTANVTFAAVPEPATWALMILGFGVVGYALRRRPSVRFAQAI